MKILFRIIAAAFLCSFFITFSCKVSGNNEIVSYADSAQESATIEQQATNVPVTNILEEPAKNELPDFVDLLYILVPDEGQKTASWKISQDDQKIIKLKTATPQKGNGDILYIKGTAVTYLNNNPSDKIALDFTLYGNSMDGYNSVYFSHYDIYNQSPLAEFMNFYTEPENQQEISITQTQKGGGMWQGIFEVKINGKTPIRASYGGSQNGNDGTPSSIILEMTF